MKFNKGAMFGKLSQLDCFNLKRAAMFGLDARIALAIFGALSVISGAALYSAIKTAKAESWRQHFVELVKATEQHYLDTGSLGSIFNSTNITIKAGSLATNVDSLVGWKGPYFSVDFSSVEYFQDVFTKKVSNTSRIYIYLRTISPWSEMNDVTADGMCTVNSTDCAQWITLDPYGASGTNNVRQLFADLDDLVDNGDGALNGKVRYNTVGAELIMYQGIPQKRLN